jgi:hypothetical protein
VLALKDSSLAATEAAVEAQAATAEAMDARVEAVLEWKEADEEATVRACVVDYFPSSKAFSS